MESTLLSTLQQGKSSMAKKSTKQTKKKTKPIKVRYISNPMMVETCASKFRELVQELTGQGAADLPPEPPIFLAGDSSPASDAVPATEALADREPYHDVADRVPEYYFEPLDGDVSVPPHTSESFSGCFTNGFYSVNALGSIDSV
ncbi:PREDICTED: sigma factor binding protein 2, chloroplastic-like [Tarenaya hassleriana]|uniref:sigma factor binding protein 2, chloroplastic-like n=1 Tax=Tarenaya hassleriana TaxID=28532 RepID=UPI00053C55A0|nr:PREDICTED: sigma factor binding protein 2, chloroplastic-like [Tarenaya hassleriana]